MIQNIMNGMLMLHDYYRLLLAPVPAAVLSVRPLYTLAANVRLYSRFPRFAIVNIEILPQPNKRLAWAMAVILYYGGVPIRAFIVPNLHFETHPGFAAKFAPLTPATVAGGTLWCRWRHASTDTGTCIAAVFYTMHMRLVPLQLQQQAFILLKVL